MNWVVPAAELDAKVDEVVEKLAAKLPQTTRYAKQQLNFWRDLSWHETVNHARDWLALSMLGDEAQEAVKAFLKRSSRRARRSDRDRPPEPAGAAERAFGRTDGRARRRAAASSTQTSPSAASSSAARERAFAAGADIGELARSSAIELYYARRVERWDAIRNLWTPLVAAVSGYCLGGGCELAMLCDLIIASETARFGQPETSARDHSRRRRHAAADARRRQGDRDGRDPERPALSAREALRAGLVARVVAREAWLEEAKRVAREIASKGPVATRLAKEAVDRAFESPLHLGPRVRAPCALPRCASEDANEGLTAFIEKRKPKFKGRSRRARRGRARARARCPPGSPLRARRGRSAR